MIEVLHHEKEIAQLLQDENRHILQYRPGCDIADSISLTMPSNHPVYIHERYLHPYFEMFLPEGYLYELFKQLLAKRHGKVDDFAIFSLLAQNIAARITYRTKAQAKAFEPISLQELIENDTPDLFHSLVHRFLEKNAISGIQPKSIAVVADKGTLGTKEYIVKTWGDEYPHLAENEYFCMQAVRYAGVATPQIILSANKRFLLVENFTYDKESEEFLGFEEVLVLMGKNRIDKYRGSYEQVVKTIESFVTEREESLESFFKLMVLNYLLKNGDAHLKNFGLLYSDDFRRIFFAPAYDVICTLPYIFVDRPALTLFGKKVWYGRDALLEYGQKYCHLSRAQAMRCYEACYEGVERACRELEAYLEENPAFLQIGLRILHIWRFSLEHHTETFKELPREIVRAG